eukprot:scaffold703_cov245-Pinguiococcus_pyrenoidosus.AAC.21
MARTRQRSRSEDGEKEDSLEELLLDELDASKDLDNQSCKTSEPETSDEPSVPLVAKTEQCDEQSETADAADLVLQVGVGYRVKQSTLTRVLSKTYKRSEVLKTEMSLADTPYDFCTRTFDPCAINGKTYLRLSRNRFTKIVKNLIQELTHKGRSIDWSVGYVQRIKSQAKEVSITDLAEFGTRAMSTSKDEPLYLPFSAKTQSATAIVSLRLVGQDVERAKTRPNKRKVSSTGDLVDERSGKRILTDVSNSNEFMGFSKRYRSLEKDWIDLCSDDNERPSTPVFRSARALKRVEVNASERKAMTLQRKIYDMRDSPMLKAFAVKHFSSALAVARFFLMTETGPFDMASLNVADWSWRPPQEALE